MKKSLTKKFIGTAIFTIAIFTATLSTYSVASAALILKGNKVTATGTVLSVDVGNNQFSFMGSGTAPVTITVTNDTEFVGISGLADMEAGDLILLKDTKTDGVNYANKVKQITENQAYGQTPVRVQTGNVSAKSETTLTVLVGSTNITFYIVPETEFVGKSFADLAIGDQVMVSATDNGTTYLGKKVVFVE